MFGIVSARAGEKKVIEMLNGLDDEKNASEIAALEKHINEEIKKFIVDAAPYIDETSPDYRGQNFTPAQRTKLREAFALDILSYRIAASYFRRNFHTEYTNFKEFDLQTIGPALARQIGQNPDHYISDSNRKREYSDGFKKALETLKQRSLILVDDAAQPDNPYSQLRYIRAALAGFHEAADFLKLETDMPSISWLRDDIAYKKAMELKSIEVQSSIDAYELREAELEKIIYDIEHPPLFAPLQRFFDRSTEQDQYEVLSWLSDPKKRANMDLPADVALRVGGVYDLDFYATKKVYFPKHAPSSPSTDSFISTEGQEFYYYAELCNARNRDLPKPSEGLYQIKHYKLDPISGKAGPEITEEKILSLAEAIQRLQELEIVTAGSYTRVTDKAFIADTSLESHYKSQLAQHGFRLEDLTGVPEILTSPAGRIAAGSANAPDQAFRTPFFIDTKGETTWYAPPVAVMLMAAPDADAPKSFSNATRNVPEYRKGGLFDHKFDVIKIAIPIKKDSTGAWVLDEARETSFQRTLNNADLDVTTYNMMGFCNPDFAAVEGGLTKLEMMTADNIKFLRGLSTSKTRINGFAPKDLMELPLAHDYFEERHIGFSGISPVRMDRFNADDLGDGGVTFRRAVSLARNSCSAESSGPRPSPEHT